ncbi:hypothetical protein [Lacrimispora sp.]|uniref:hypothetical protein n=1 Tax=Lacrimispora sp. TaxID=2719234 RepID=UPI00345F6FAF
MARVFYPRRSVFVNASAPHPKGTQYKVSLGDEEWEGIFHNVIKVQMIYDGKVAGRKSPSYPIDTEDAVRVHEAIQVLMNNTTEAVR